jgi:predicted HAD superfamily phosphohydrolase
MDGGKMKKYIVTEEQHKHLRNLVSVLPAEDLFCAKIILDNISKKPVERLEEANLINLLTEFFTEEGLEDDEITERIWHSLGEKTIKRLSSLILALIPQQKAMDYEKLIVEYLETHDFNQARNNPNVNDMDLLNSFVSFIKNICKGDEGND